MLLHIDAAQSLGKIDVDIDALAVDLLTVVGHKMYAPKGIGALYIRRGVGSSPLIDGGGQERAGAPAPRTSPSPPDSVKPATLAAGSLAAGETPRLQGPARPPRAPLAELLPDRVHVNGHLVDRLPNTANVSIDGSTALGVITDLERRCRVRGLGLSRRPRASPRRY